MTNLVANHLSQGATLDATYPDIPASFGNDELALAAVEQGAIVIDRSHWGQLLVTDADRLRFLHNQSTADFNSLKPGASCNTVFVNSTGRTIDLALAVILEDTVQLLVSPGKGDFMFQWLDRYIFFADKVQVQDISATTAALSLIGTESRQILAALGADVPAGFHQTLLLDDHKIQVVADSGLGLPGYTFLLEEAAAPVLWQKLVALGAVPAGEQCWERLRIQQGRPAVDVELTTDYNPLEVGLWQTISFTKGCYIGQETIARLNTYKGVKQYLWGIELSAAVDVGSELWLDDAKVGVVTSCLGQQGLVYLKAKAGGVDSVVQVGDIENKVSGKIVAIPFVSHEYYGGDES
jgi:tRNA-modifying protein YgfZ